MKTSKEETVNATPATEGPSEMTTLDPQQRAEAAARRKRELAIEFLKAQEEALAAEPLPLSRREEVLRYLTALRKRLEEGGN